MHALMERGLTMRQNRLSLLRDKLTALGPRQALSRGYAVVLADGKAVTSVDQTQEYMTLVMLDGRVDVKTLNARKENPFGEEAANL